MKMTFKACLLGLLFPVLLNGQETGLLRIAPDRPAIQGEAAIWGGAEEGGFKPTYAALFQWSAGADANITRHGKSSSWMGALSFKQTMGTQMYSSMLVEPEYYPFDILEFVPGPKSRQDVRLETGFLTDIGYEWALGLKAEAKGARSAKQQDVRHSSMGIDVRLEPVLTYVMDDNMGLVSSYRVSNRWETLKAVEEADDLFLDEGMRYGSYQPLEGNGYFPIQELSHGLSELFYSPEFSAGLEVIWKFGHAGGKSYERFTFPGNTISAFFQHSVLADKVDHVYGVSYSRMWDILRLMTVEGFQTQSDRNHRNLELKYEARFVQGALKSAGINLAGNRWKEHSSLGPDLILRYDGSATAHMAFSFDIIDLDLSASLANGWWKERGLAGQEGDTQPGRLVDDWLTKMDYLMAYRMGCGGTLTGHISSNLYVQLHAYWHHAFKITYLGGQNREIATLKIGYKF